jgi:pSer/pThr/pTyr-binding forkhead associated (FHA) protein
MRLCQLQPGTAFQAGLSAWVRNAAPLASAPSPCYTRAMAAPQTEVIITVDGIEKGRHVLAPGDYVIGRNADCHLRVDADLVSRQHAKLTLNFDNALIEDLGSSNGTFVNDAPITGRTRLWPGQKIRIGAATLTLRRLQGEPPTDMSLAPAQMAIRRMLPAEMLREKK